MKKVITSYVLLAVVACALVLWPKIFPITGDEMGYGIIAYVIVFPIASLILGFISGLGGMGYGLLCVFLSGLFSVVMPLIVFGSTDKQYMLLPVGAALVGLACSLGIEKLRDSKNEDD